MRAAGRRRCCGRRYRSRCSSAAPTIPAPPLPAGSVSTAYERMITFGVEYGPYTRLAAAFRDLILGLPSEGPPPATFADGVAMMTVLDAARRSAAAGGAWTVTDPSD